MALAGLLERFDQEQDFGGHRVVQIRSVGQGAVAAAGDDGLEGADQWEEPRRVRIGGKLLEKRSGRRLEIPSGLGMVTTEPLANSPRYGMPATGVVANPVGSGSLPTGVFAKSAGSGLANGRVGGIQSS